MILDGQFVISNTVKRVGLGAQSMGERFWMVEMFGDHQTYFRERKGLCGIRSHLLEHKILKLQDGFGRAKLRMGV